NLYPFLRNWTYFSSLVNRFYSVLAKVNADNDKKVNNKVFDIFVLPIFLVSTPKEKAYQKMVCL
ncbi:hypothetical protein, partial [Cetobacterium sp. ZWU0022]|uniref:hypothetical protein n=1 Tax=Cetobacterium sp. ZWU0022 TaxID=1340502 RepID=UPI001E489DB4